jgi:hypothetical protein
MNEREDDGMELDELRSDRTWQTLRRAEPRLDDMTRARMLAGIRQRLADTAEEPLIVPTRSRATWLLGAAALVATAAVVILMWKDTGDGTRRGAGTASIEERAIIGPYLYEGDAGYPLDQQVEALSLSADAVVRAWLGDQGRITLHGPAALAVMAPGLRGLRPARPDARPASPGCAWIAACSWSITGARARAPWPSRPRTRSCS